MNLRTSLLTLGLSLATATAFAAPPAAPSDAAAKPAEHSAKAAGQKECLKRSSAGHCEKWASKAADKSATPEKH